MSDVPAKPPPGLLEAMVDSIPAPLFVLDDDLRILYANPAGIEMLCHDRTVLINRRCGEVFHCQHSLESRGGCGRNEHCKDCVIRKAVREACATGSVSQGMAHMNRAAWVSPAFTHIFVMASGFAFQGRTLATLVLQDVPDMVSATGLVPLCAWCHKVRSPEGNWQGLEGYLSDQLRVSVSHGMCPECAAKLASESQGGAPANSETP